MSQPREGRELIGRIFSWLASGEPAGDAKKLPREFAVLHGRAQLTNTEMLAVLAYAALAARVQPSAARRTQALFEETSAPASLHALMEKELFPVLERLGGNLTAKTLLERTPDGVVEAVNTFVLRLEAVRADARRRELENLDSVLFEHPDDRAAKRSIQNVPGVSGMIGKAVDLHKRHVEINLLGGAFLVTEDSLPQVHETLVEACRALAVPRLPALYLRDGPIGALTYGVDAPYIVLNSASVALLSREELLFVLGHELGHIQADHVKYHTLAGAMAASTQVGALMVSLAAVVVSAGTLLPLLAAWARSSELTADRAGLLACQNRDAALRALTKLSGFPMSLYGHLHPRHIVAQAEQFAARLDASFLDRAFNAGQLWLTSHPHTVLRANRLTQWWAAGNAQDLVAMSGVERKRAKALAQADPEQADLLFEILAALSDWAATRWKLRPADARQHLRAMIFGGQSARSTPLEPLLRVDLVLERKGANQTCYRLILLTNEKGAPTRVTLELPRAAAWDDLPPGFRERFIRDGKREAAWTLYSVS